VKHKTSELTGALLDAAVLKALLDSGEEVHTPGSPLRYSSSWQFGGPIIERERIELFSPRSAPDYNRWEARHSPPGDIVRVYAGPTALIAAMRAYVASKLGPVVELPD
jgi:hypothetical protein